MHFLLYDQYKMFVVFYKKLKNVSYEHDRLNGCTKPWAKRMAENTRFAGVCVGAGAARSGEE